MKERTGTLVYAAWILWVQGSVVILVGLLTLVVVEVSRTDGNPGPAPVDPYWHVLGATVIVFGIVLIASGWGVLRGVRWVAIAVLVPLVVTGLVGLIAVVSLFFPLVQYFLPAVPARVLTIGGSIALNPIVSIVAGSLIWSREACTYRSGRVDRRVST